MASANSSARRGRVQRLQIDEQGAAANRAAHRRMATSLGWQIRENRGKPVIDGTQRPGIATGIAEMVLGDGGRDLGRVQWSYLSSVMHVTWYGLRQSIVEGPADDVRIGPSIASVGTQSRSVNAQSLCLLRALRYAGTGRMTMMGWLDDEWHQAAHQSETHERALLEWIIAANR